VKVELAAHSRFFAVSSEMGREVNPKAEIRNPSRSSARADSDLGSRATEDGSAFEKRERSPASAFAISLFPQNSGSHFCRFLLATP
jgi:hypothetical protein